MSEERTMRMKLKVANRTYPLNVRLEEEASLRNASKRIAQMMEELEKAYAVSDTQDLLAMTAIQLASSLERQQSSSSLDEEAVVQELDKLIGKLGAFK
ncbi:MAG: Uncharacterised protein [Flavobacteriia bacterium]|nr:MAG: Uncharacterised protein [Flavobacteriia bacterium]